MELLQRRVLLGGIIGLVILVLLFIFLLYLPQFKQQVKITHEVASLKKQLKDNEAIARDIVKIRAQVSDLENKEKIFMSQIVPRSELLAVIKELAQEGEPYHLTFTEINPPSLDTLIQIDNQGTPVSPVPFIVTVQGRYLEIAQFIESLKDFPYFVRTPEFEIIGKDEIRPMVECRILLNIYASSLVAGANL
jgi:Tfp pilus assembly protein PilO